MEMMLRFRAHWLLCAAFFVLASCGPEDQGPVTTVPLHDQRQPDVASATGPDVADQDADPGDVPGGGASTAVSRTAPNDPGPRVPTGDPPHAERDARGVPAMPPSAPPIRLDQWPVDRHPAMGDAINAVLARVPAGGGASVAVARCDEPVWLHRHQVGRLRQLASVNKVLVSAATLLELGRDYQFQTRLVALGPIADGAIPSLGVIGGGSPCLDEHFAPDRDPDIIFRSWAARLRERGISRITGDIIIDSSLFSGPIRPTTYRQDPQELTRWYSAPASAFAFNDNCIDVQAVPTTPGQPCRIITRPAGPRIQVNNRTQTVARGGDARFTVGRYHHENRINVGGRYSEPTSVFPLAIHEDPDLLAGDHLRGILESAGIAVGGTVRLGTVPPGIGELLVDHRDPLLPAITILNQRSQNFYGEQMLRLCGQARFGDGSITAGYRAVEAILQDRLGLDPQSLQVLDGSGLSYENRATAESVVQLLVAMHHHPDGAAFHDTLREENGRGYTGRVKTGTLNVARCLAGYITVDGRRYAFAILLNREEARRFVSWARPMRGDLYEAIAEALVND